MSSKKIALTLDALITKLGELRADTGGAASIACSSPYLFQWQDVVAVSSNPFDTDAGTLLVQKSASIVSSRTHATHVLLASWRTHPHREFIKRKARYLDQPIPFIHPYTPHYALLVDGWSRISAKHVVPCHTLSAEEKQRARKAT